MVEIIEKIVFTSVPMFVEHQTVSNNVNTSMQAIKQFKTYLQSQLLIFFNYTGRQNNYISVHLMESDFMKSKSHEEVVKSM